MGTHAMSVGGRSAWRSLAWVAGALATTAAVAVGAVLAVVFAATVVVIGFMASMLLALAAFALRARRTVKAAPPSDPSLIEARHVGGHSWVAYGWNDRA
ncbi:MAG: hypothetical protein JWP92_2973 [Caulobacter sp.]|jgi:hypothetical protein|nr:hypothetical protein [Caulobacter sp.]